MIFDNLYLEKTVSEELNRDGMGITVISSRDLEGSFAVVHAETGKESRIRAEQIVSVLSWLCDDTLLKRFCQTNGAIQVASSLSHSLGLGRLVGWQEVSGEDKELLAKVAYELLEDFRVWALAHNRDGEHIGA